MRQFKSRSLAVFNIFAYIHVFVLALFCFLPFVIIISGSLTDNNSIILNGYGLLPSKFSLSAYKMLFASPGIIGRAYLITSINTFAGVAVGLFFISMAGYVLSRKEFKYRNGFSFFIYFTTLFGGGLVPWYILITKTLKLQDSYIAIWFPLLMTPFLIILMRTFIASSIPDEIFESSKIDGAGHFRTYARITLPIIKPGLATVGLFLALNYWNDWYLSSLFITTPNKYGLQFYLYNMLNSYDAINNILAGKNVSINVEMPTESVKLAMAVIATGPVLLFYPFVQRYFITGLTIGAVKG